MTFDADVEAFRAEFVAFLDASILAEVAHWCTVCRSVISEVVACTMFVSGPPMGRRCTRGAVESLP